MITTVVQYLLDQYDLWRYSRFYFVQNVKHRKLWEASVLDHTREAAQLRDENEALSERIAALSDANRRLRRTIIAIHYKNAARRQSVLKNMEQWHERGRRACLEWADAVEAMQSGCKC